MKERTFRYEALLPSASRATFGRASQSAWWRVTGGSLDAPLLVRIGRRGDVIACTGLAFGVDDGASRARGSAPMVTTTTLRIPLAEIVGTIARTPTRGYKVTRAGRSTMVEFDNPRGLLGYFVDAGPRATPRVRLGAKGHPPEHYEELVRRYRKALRTHPAAPTKAVCEQYPNFKPVTVRYWLGVARRRGLLGQAAPGRAGEITSTTRRARTRARKAGKR